MAKKRKASKNFEKQPAPKSTKFDIEERFDDSEDDFFAGKDKILLDDSAATRRRQRLIDQEKKLQPSDEEVLGLDEEGSLSENGAEDLDEVDSDDASMSDGGAPARDDDDDEGSEEEVWGTNRAEYYGDDVIETEEQAKEEENEAKRLHQKQLKNMTEADFGFDEDSWITEQKDTKTSRSIAEKLPEIQLPENATEQEKLKILNTRYPELLPLAEDFHSLQSTMSELENLAAEAAKGLQNGLTLSEGIPVHIKRDALKAYLAGISMYFAIISSNATTETPSRKITAMAPLELHDHAVVSNLARARQLWDQVRDLKHSTLVEAPPVLLPKEQPHSTSTINPPVVNGKPSKKEKTKATKSSTTKLASTTDQKPSKKPKKTSDKKKPLDINTLLTQTQTVDSDGNATESDFGDEQPLTADQHAAKALKRKSLRFYTSQLASKANKRGQASRIAGGDDDLPYKERQRDKNERLIRAAEVRGRAAADDFNDDGDGDDDDTTMRRNRDTNDEYYDTLLNAKQAKQSDKLARTEAYATAAKEGAVVYEEETVGADGKRAITYAIAKNKGLAPRRSKDVRNPRVKKRKKYDEKMKKLSSMRAVYKGGEGRGGYGGESGIKTNLVKSIKL